MAFPRVIASLHFFSYSYDALLGCAGSWDELCRRGVLHGGDNDSTGAIAGAWYGALYGNKDVNYLHFHVRYLNKRNT